MHGGIIPEYNDNVKGFLQFYKKLGMLPLEGLRRCALDPDEVTKND